jgi:hypothetical protein
MTTIWSKATKNAADFTKRVKNFLVYFWGTDDGKYVVSDTGLRIVFSEDLSLVGRTKNAADYTNRTKN